MALFALFIVLLSLHTILAMTIDYATNLTYYATNIVSEFPDGQPQVAESLPPLLETSQQLNTTATKTFSQTASATSLPLILLSSPEASLSEKTISPVDTATEKPMETQTHRVDQCFERGGKPIICI